MNQSKCLGVLFSYSYSYFSFILILFIHTLEALKSSIPLALKLRVNREHQLTCFCITLFAPLSVYGGCNVRLLDP